MITLLKNVKMLAIVTALGLGVTALAQPARADMQTSGIHLKNHRPAAVQPSTDRDANANRPDSDGVTFYLPSQVQIYSAPAPTYSAPSSAVFTGPTFVPNPCGPGFVIGYRQ